MTNELGAASKPVYTVLHTFTGARDGAFPNNFGARAFTGRICPPVRMTRMTATKSRSRGLVL